MTDKDTRNPIDGDDQTRTLDAVPSDGPKRSWGKRAMFGGAIAGLVIGGGILAVTNSGFARGGDGGYMRGFMEYRIERALDDVDATPEQTAKVKAIIEQVRTDLAPMSGGFRDTRDALTTILQAPTVDRAELEKLRAERIGAMDAASRRLTTALADVADVLTPEQRRELVQEMGERRGHRW